MTVATALWEVRIQLRSFVVLLVVLPAASGAQQAREIAGGPTCQTCSIRVEHVITLAPSLHDPLSLSLGSTVATDSRGNYIVAPTMNPGEIALFDREGRYKHSFGRPGRGPGEFGEPLLKVLVSAGDTVHVIHENRHTMLLPDLAGLVGSRQLENVPRYSTLLESGHFAFQYITRSGGAVKLIHVVDANGFVRASFGGEDLDLTRDGPFETVRNLQPARGGGLWAAPINAYRITRYREDGTKELELVRSLEWFRSWKEQHPEAPLHALPVPRLLSMRQDASGFLWVVVLVPALDWRPSTKPRGREVTAGSYDRDLVYDTIIEAIDPVEVRVLAQTRETQPLGPFFDGQARMYAPHLATDGQHVVDIWRLSLPWYPPGRLR